MKHSERRKTKVETPPIVSKTRRTKRCPIEARLQGHPLRVNAADLPRRRFLHLAASAAALPVVSCEPEAQSYPTRPITIVVPYPPGGATDVIARNLAERMKVSLGQPVIIENVSGAAGTIGTGRVARARPTRSALVKPQITSSTARPMRCQFVINLQTAKTLALSVPPLLLAIADEVIE